MKFQNNRLSYQANLSRHSHDVSAGYCSSLTTGPIVPQYFDILGPGDTMYYRTHMFARLQDIVCPFLGEVDIHIDYFFVPLQMLYTPFGQLFAQTDDYLTSLYSDMTNKDTFPYCTESVVIPTKNSNFRYGHRECVGKETMRLLDALDLNPYVVVNATQQARDNYEPTGQEPTALSVFRPFVPWIPCAYQAIYQKYYRNDDYEALSVCDYNFDKYYNQLDIGGNSNNAILKLNYVQRLPDYFTTLRVSPISSAVNGQRALLDPNTNDGRFPDNGGALSGLLTKVNDFIGVTSNSEFTPADAGLGTTESAFEVGSLTNDIDDTSNHTVLVAQNIRALFALDKFMRIYGRTEKTYDAQILAHYGIKVPHDVKHDITHLKSYRFSIQADPIYGTANNVVDGQTISSIGQAGGQGANQIDTEQEKFTAPVHGVFMAVAYAITKPRYELTYSKLHCLDSRLKFPIAEFDKLGAQPLYSFEIYPENLAQNQIVGWQNRYQEFKKKYNRASLTYIYNTIGWEQSGSPAIGLTNNVYAPWVLTRIPFSLWQYGFDSGLIPATELFESPYALNGVMQQEYDGRWSNDYFLKPHLVFQNDPIITDFMCFAKKVSWMSETGEPDL